MRLYRVNGRYAPIFHGKGKLPYKHFFLLVVVGFCFVQADFTDSGFRVFFK